jgi:AcrR family transcriptional regulator
MNDARAVNPGRRSQTVRRLESDKKMLRAATELIARKGVGQATLSEIGLAAGYSSGLPPMRFGSKVGLLDALLTSMSEWCDQRLQSATAGLQGLEAVRARLDAHVENAVTYPQGAVAFQLLAIESRYSLPDLRSHVDAINTRWRHDLEMDIRVGQALGQVLPGIDAAAYANLMMAATAGTITLEGRIHGAREMLRPFIDNIAQLADDSVVSSDEHHPSDVLAGTRRVPST